MDAGRYGSVMPGFVMTDGSNSALYSTADETSFAVAGMAGKRPGRASPGPNCLP